MSFIIKSEFRRSLPSMSSSLTPSPLSAGSAGPLPGRALRDWLGSQAQILDLWLDRLIAEGDPDDLISMIHRHQVWLSLISDRMAR